MQQPDSYHVRPLELGDMLDQSIKVLLSRRDKVLHLLLILHMPVAIAIQALIVSLESAIQRIGEQFEQSGGPQQPPDPEVVLRAILDEMAKHLPSIFLISILSILLVLFSLAAIRAVVGAHTGEDTSVKECAFFALRRFLPSFVTGFCTSIAMIFGLALCCVPGFMIMMAAVIINVVIAVEGAWGPSAIARSWRLVSKGWGTAFVMLLIVAIVASIPGFLGKIIPWAPAEVLLGAALSGLANALVAAIATEYYLSMRATQEGMTSDVLAYELGVPNLLGPSPYAPQPGWGTGPGGLDPSQPPGYVPPPGYTLSGVPGAYVPPQQPGAPQGYPPAAPPQDSAYGQGSWSAGYPPAPTGYPPAPQGYGAPPPGYPQGYPPQNPYPPQGDPYAQPYAPPPHYPPPQSYPYPPPQPPGTPYPPQAPQQQNDQPPPQNPYEPR